MRAYVAGTGMAVPEKVLSNADLEKLVDTTDEWIVSRSGIKERRVASADESLSTFAVPAAMRAMEMAEVHGEEVDLVICATVTPDMPFPATANLVANRIGATRAASFDLSAGCTGFAYGLGVADQFLRTGWAKTVVVVGGEVLTKITDWTDRSTCVLFGDGAGAVVLRPTEEERGILSVALHSDGSLTDLIFMPGGGSKHPPSRELYESNLQFIKMRGNETYKIAVRSLTEVSEEVLAQCGMTPADVDWFVPHQANRRILEAVRERLSIPEERAYVNIDRYGNTSAASIPIALHELNSAGKLRSGQVLLLAAFGAGLTWGAAVVRW